MQLGEEIRNWEDAMKLVWQSIQPLESDSLNDLFEPLSSWKNPEKISEHRSIYSWKLHDILD